MALGSVSSEVADDFRRKLPEKMLEPQWNRSQTYENGELVGLILGTLILT